MTCLYVLQVRFDNTHTHEVSYGVVCQAICYTLLIAPCIAQVDQQQSKQQQLIHLVKARSEEGGNSI